MSGKFEDRVKKIKERDIYPRSISTFFPRTARDKVTTCICPKCHKVLSRTDQANVHRACADKTCPKCRIRGIPQSLRR